MRERNFQAGLIRDLKNMLPGCIILKNDSSYKQGVPDLIILYQDRWAALECKNNKHAHQQPNQKYYVDLMNEMSFSDFIYPENKQQILNELKDFMLFS